MTARTSPGLVARNSVLNLVTEAWGFVVMLCAIPALLKALGESGFGLFLLAWAFVGYITVFDIGVSRAATKFVSEHLADNDTRGIRQTVQAALLSNLALGVLAGLLTVLCAPVLIKHAFRVSSPLQSDARYIIYVIAVAMPFLLVQAALRGVLSSYQRFDWINLVNGVLGTLQWAVAWFLGRSGFGPAIVVLSVVVVRVIGTFVLFAVVLWLCPRIIQLAWGGFRSLLRLYRFGGWVSVSQLVSPVLVYLDRVLIARFLSLAAVSLYAVPYEAVFRLTIIPRSAAATLFPAFSEKSVSGNSASVQNLYRRSCYYLFLLLVPGVIFFVVFGKDILSLWLGPSFAQPSAVVLQILALGVLVNGLAYVPYNLLQALGRPDLTGKFHLVEFPIYIGMCCLCIPMWGIAGAAVANTARLALDAALLFLSVRKYFSMHVGLKDFVPAIITAMLLMIASVMMALWLGTPLGRVTAGMLLAGAYFLGTWSFVLSPTDRPAIARVLRLSRATEQTQSC